MYRLIKLKELHDKGKIQRARELETIMKDAGLIVFPNSSHYAYLENIVQVVKIINEFV